MSSRQKKPAHIGLGIGLVVLVALTALLLVLLQGSDNDEAGDASPIAGVRQQTPPEKSPTRRVRRVDRRKEPRIRRVAPADPARHRVAPPPRTGPAPKEPLGVHTAPAAIPTEIANETDPAKKARLMRMHTLAVARTRASRLRRRLQMLEDTLTRARREKNWSADQIASTEQDVTQLKRAVKRAERNVEKAKEAVD